MSAHIDALRDIAANHGWPVCELAADEIEDLEDRVAFLEERLQIEVLLRPQWAMGYSSDSIAAQSSSGALHTLWGLLGVANQTEAIIALRQARDEPCR